MRKKTKTLSGASQDAYFRRVLKTHPDLPAEERDKLVRRLRQEVAQLRVRVEPRPDGSVPLPSARARAETPAAKKAACNPHPAVADLGHDQVHPTPSVPPFDPFSPNIIVVLRTLGRDAVLAALDAIDGADDLRLLAREQRLSVDPELTSPADLRQAILAAAERRVANRMAAAT